MESFAKRRCETHVRVRNLHESKNPYAARRIGGSTFNVVRTA